MSYSQKKKKFERIYSDVVKDGRSEVSRKCVCDHYCDFMKSYEITFVYATTDIEPLVHRNVYFLDLLAFTPNAVIF